MIHAVGPVWHGGGRGEAGLLAAYYRHSLELAAGAGLGSIAFPCISTGVYGYPPALVAPVAIGAVTVHSRLRARHPRGDLLLLLGECVPALRGGTRRARPESVARSRYTRTSPAPEST